MVTDDERREVATRLRANAKAHPHMGLLLNFAFADKGLNPDGEMEYNVTSYHAALRLADLIEPEPERTCRDVSRGGENFKCSECGTVVEVEHDDSLLYIGGLTDDFDYCPGCGAKVVEK